VFEKRGNISNTNVLTKKPVVFGFSKKTANVSMMSPSDLLATLILNAFRTLHSVIIERQNQTKLLRSTSMKVLFRSHKNEFYELILRALRRRNYSEGYGKYIDDPFHSTDSKPHCILRAIKATTGDEKDRQKRFRHLQ
jgi:hypothetical protein